MSFSTSLIGLLLIFAVFLLISEVYLKRVLGIKAIRKCPFNAKRKKRYVFTEIILLLLFIFSMFYAAIDLTLPPTIMIFIFFAIMDFIRGMEEWIENKSEKGYYHEWLATITFIIMFLVVLIAEV